MDIRIYTRLIVKKGRLYLQGNGFFGLTWTPSRYDAWMTRNICDAEKVAKLLGGELWLFNKANGATAPLKQ